MMDRLGIAALGLLLASASATQASPQAFSIDYGLSFLAIPVGTTKLKAERNGERYAIDLDGGLSGLAGWFFQGSGKVGSKGRVSSSGMVPSSFRIDARYSDYPVKVSVTFDDGTARSASVEPMPTPRPDRMPVPAADKKDVTDPIGMLAIPAPTGPFEPSLCDRRIPVFDGLTRADLVLSRGSVTNVKSGPYRGPVLDCRVRWVPVSGHRPNGSSVKRMRDNDDIYVRLAPAPEVGLLLPLSIVVGTGWGTAKIEATRWGSLAQKSAADAKAAKR